MFFFVLFAFPIVVAVVVVDVVVDVIVLLVVIFYLGDGSDVA